MSDYKLTIYADIDSQVGHFSIGVTGPGINEPIAGKYMRDDSPLDKFGVVMGGAPGEVRDDSGQKGKEGVVEQDILLTKEEAERAAAYIASARENPGDYELFGKNCIDLVQSTIDAAGKDVRIDEIFDDEVLDAMGRRTPYGAGDEAQRRGRIIDVGKDIEEFRGSENAPFGPHADADDLSGNDKVARASTETPELAKLKAGLMPSEKDGAREELLYKSADQLTDAEVTELGHWYHDLQPSDPLRGTLDQKRRDFYELTYGNDPAEMDATGRMVMPTPKRGVPETATPAKSKDGMPLADGIKRIVGTLAKAAATLGHGEAVKGLQSGLNLAGQNLKVDGVPGPKTKAGLMKAVAEKGAGKTEETAALGMFQRFAEAERAKGGSASGLKDTVQENVQPLLGEKNPTAAAEVLQETLNSLAKDAADQKKTPKSEPLKIDGDIGEKTTGAFRIALMDHGPERLTKRFGKDLGF